MLNVAQVPARPPARATKEIINPVQSAYMSSLQSCKDVLTSYPPPAPLSLCPLLPWPPSSMPATASTTPLPHRTTRLATASTPPCGVAALSISPALRRQLLAISRSSSSSLASWLTCEHGRAPAGPGGQAAALPPGHHHVAPRAWREWIRARTERDGRPCPIRLRFISLVGQGQSHMSHLESGVSGHFFRPH